MLITERMTCRSCDVQLPKTNVLNLGNQTIVDFLLPGEKGRGEAPLELVLCENCNLLQLRHSVNQDVLFRKFWYRSGVNEQMRAALLDIVKSALERVDLKDGDFVCDVGSNDGTLLKFYDSSPEWVKRVGFEPATELAEESWKKLEDGIILSDYFNAKAALSASGGYKYKIVSGIAMFYDIESPRLFLNDVYSVLDEEGIFIVQMNYLRTMLRNLSFDNIGHEHLCYYSLTSLNKLFNCCGFTIVDLELNEVNGGSIRVYAQKNTERAPRKMSQRVAHLLNEEDQASDAQLLSKFAKRVTDVSAALKYFLCQLKLAGKTVYAYGASTRGSTLLQTMLQGTSATELIAGVAERDQNKYGRKMAGLGLEIVSEEEARAKADFMILLPYHFWSSISQRERKWMEAGGKFILPVPYPKVASLSDLFDQKVLVTEELHVEAAGVAG